MIIDIVNYTEKQLSSMKKENVRKIREAQLRKNKLLAALQEQILAEKQRLIDRGTFPSNIWEKKKADLIAACEGEIAELKDALEFYLQYVGSIGQMVPDDVPYNVDFSLSLEDRMAQVRAYYEVSFLNGQARLNAYAADTFAQTYLGELYEPLYHYIESMI